MRQIPIVGGLLNWWSPVNNNSVTGRAFNLQSGIYFDFVLTFIKMNCCLKGKIETTETLYKYHMQVQENEKNFNETNVSALSLSRQESRRNSDSSNTPSVVEQEANQEANLALLTLQNQN